MLLRLRRVEGGDRQRRAFRLQVADDHDAEANRVVRSCGTLEEASSRVPEIHTTDFSTAKGTSRGKRKGAERVVGESALEVFRIPGIQAPFPLLRLNTK